MTNDINKFLIKCQSVPNNNDIFRLYGMALWFEF